MQAALHIEREKLLDAKRSLDGALLLLEELSTKHTIALALRRMVYDKLRYVTSPTDPSYQTVIRRLDLYSEAGLTNRQSHIRMMNQIN